MDYKKLWVTMMDQLKATPTGPKSKLVREALGALIDKMSEMELAEMRKESVFDLLLQKLELERLRHIDLVREGKIEDMESEIRRCETIVADMAGYDSRQQWIEKLFGG